MIIHEISQAKLLVLAGPLIGLDIGTKNIGVSISDKNMMISNSLKVFATKELNLLKNIITDYKPTAIIAGWPIDMAAQEGKACENVMKILLKIEKITELPIILFDERFSTKIANFYLKQMGSKRKDRNFNDNSLAANIILDDFISYLKN